LEFKVWLFLNFADNGILKLVIWLLVWLLTKTLYINLFMI